LNRTGKYLLPHIGAFDKTTLSMETTVSALRRTYWDARGRWLVFALAASSIACLLADFYGLCPMRIFTPFIFLPALLALFAFAALDRWKGDGQLWRAVSSGLVAGLFAAVAYDVFRLPFLFAKEWGIESVVPPMKPFKVFPRFGAMVLGQAIEEKQEHLAFPPCIFANSHLTLNPGARFRVGMK
jgi:hypothetical protein